MKMVIVSAIVTLLAGAMIIAGIDYAHKGDELQPSDYLTVATTSIVNLNPGTEILLERDTPYTVYFPTECPDKNTKPSIRMHGLSNKTIPNIGVQIEVSCKL